MTTVDIRTIRARAYHYLSHDVAAAADMSLEQLQQFVAGNFFPDEDQLQRLANRMSLR